MGRAICIALAERGCEVWLTYNSSGEEAAGVVEELRGKSRGLIDAAGRSAAIPAAPAHRAFRVVLDDPDAARAAVTNELRGTDRLDVLVLCASVYSPSPFAALDGARVRHDFSVNAASPALIAAACAALLAKSALASGGAIVTMCDLHALGEAGRPRSGYAAYSMSKAALLELTLVLARELAPQRTRVNAVAPGVVAFPEAGRESAPAAQTAYVARVPLGRAGTPEEAAAAVVWLALDAGYCTGQVIKVDGGRGIV